MNSSKDKMNGDVPNDLWSCPHYLQQIDNLLKVARGNGDDVFIESDGSVILGSTYYKPIVRSYDTQKKIFSRGPKCSNSRKNKSSSAESSYGDEIYASDVDEFADA